MKKIQFGHLILVLLLSASSVSAHSYVEHEYESCKVCKLSSNDRDEIDEGLDNQSCIDFGFQLKQDFKSFRSEDLRASDILHQLARGPPKTFLNT